jgi:hypothetical protein
MVHRVHAVLLLGTGGTAKGPDLAIGPRLSGEPVDGVVGVGTRASEVGIGALGEVAATHVHVGEGVAILQEGLVLGVRGIEQVGVEREDGGEVLPGPVLREEERGIEALAVAHWDADHVLAFNPGGKEVGNGVGSSCGLGLGLEARSDEQGECGEVAKGRHGDPGARERDEKQRRETGQGKELAQEANDFPGASVVGSRSGFLPDCPACRPVSKPLCCNDLTE